MNCVKAIFKPSFLSLSCLLLFGCIEGQLLKDIPRSNSDKETLNSPEEKSTLTPSANSIKNPEKNNPIKPTPTAFSSSKPEFPPDSLMMISTLRQGSKTNSLPTTSGTIRWSTSNYGVIGYFPELKKTKLFTQTSSKSYAKSYIYGLTKNNKLYTVRTGTETYSKDVKLVNPKTSKTISSCYFTSNDTYKGFTIVEDAIYYRSKINKDLFGKRTSGGDLLKLTWPCSGKGETILDYQDSKGHELHGVNKELFSVIYNNERTEVFHWSLLNGKPMDMVTTIPGKFRAKVFPGNEALYWNEGTDIKRLNLEGQVEHLFSLPSDNGEVGNIGIDSSNDKVFVVYKDSQPRFYLYDLNSKQREKLHFDSSFYSPSIYGNGQFMVLE